MVNTVVSGTVCSACGEPLGTRDACFPCLLRTGLDDVGVSDDSGGDTVFGDFEIERREDGSLWELGRGAMGITYRASDKILHRAVALKVIEPPAAASDSLAMRERFLREARAAAALRHPNIAGVFHFGASPEIDRCYCAMELVEGETLEARVRREGPLKLDVALEVAVQVTRALAAAAERGLVHRDLKPGNIMLTHDGDPVRLEVKVIDFGLAKAAADVTAEMELTHGGFVGTPAFASPEQFAGDEVDVRSDIYALGVTLWFALTGRLPFPGRTIDEIREQQAHHNLPLEQLKARAVPEAVISLLRSCLAINPAERPASTGELMQAIESCRDRSARRVRRRKFAPILVGLAVLAAAVSAFLTTRPKTAGSDRPVVTADPTEKGIAVLPFENLSTNKDDAFFADGIQDDVLTSLGKIKDLKVIARASVLDYRGARRPGKVREIGRTLGVSHVLEGRVRRLGDHVVVSVALIDTRDERQVWSERYERTLTDSISLQGELAIEIARALHATLTPSEATIAAVKPTQNPEAYLLYLRAREIEIASYSKSEQIPAATQAVQLYQKALDLDPKFALARARLSLCASQIFYNDGPQEWKVKARSEAEESLRLQPQLGEARLALTHCYLWGDRDYNHALEELTRTAELLPNSAEVPLTAAFIYKRQNRYRERLAALRRAEALDPRNRRVLYVLTSTLRWVRDWPEALQIFDRVAAVAPDPSIPDRWWSRADDAFRLSGDINTLKKAIAEEADGHAPVSSDWLTEARYETAMLERDYTQAARFLSAATPETFSSACDQGFGHTKAFHEALLAVAGNTDAATRQKSLEVAREETEARLIWKDGGADVKALADLGLLYAFLGRKEEAIREALRAVAVPGGGMIEENDVSSALAMVYTHTGEPEKAIDLIERLLTEPTEVQRGAVYNMTHTDLKWRWQWDPLRSHPRFQKILAGPEPETVY